VPNETKLQTPHSYRLGNETETQPGFSALTRAQKGAEAHESMQLGLTDASPLALATHLPSSQIPTLEERHFRAVKQDSGRAVRLPPGEAG
jgi:hypothetical protein